jgi:hypothetical protein
MSIAQHWRKPTGRNEGIGKAMMEALARISTIADDQPSTNRHCPSLCAGWEEGSLRGPTCCLYGH